MPNWCSNRITVTGDGIAAFCGKISKEDEFSFNDFIPEPDEMKDIECGFNTIGGKKYSQWRFVGVVNGEPDYEGLEEEELKRLTDKYGATNLYDWHTLHWGTKWDAVGSVIISEENQCIVDFDTAWSPPEAFVIEVSRQFPELIFELAFSEGGCCFYGLTAAQNGMELPCSYYSEDYWKSDAMENDDDDFITENCKKHLLEYGLHTGG